MRLWDLVRRTSIPLPWDEGDNIPWNDPDFSERMLKEHLSQAHDAASRRTDKIEKHVGWIQHGVLKGHTVRVLDLGCGPGLYTSRLAQLGHECVGIDYSPASIRYAMDISSTDHLACTYLCQDIRQAEFGTGFGLVMLIYGEFNVFRPTEAERILKKANHALAEHGLLVLEPHTFAAVRKIGKEGTSWYAAEAGLFSIRPHLCLRESFWDSASEATTVRYFIVDASSGEVTRYAQSLQAYTDAQYQALLTQCGFDPIRFFPSLTGAQDETSGELMAIVAEKHHSI